MSNSTNGTPTGGGTERPTTEEGGTARTTQDSNTANAEGSGTSRRDTNREDTDKKKQAKAAFKGAMPDVGAVLMTSTEERNNTDQFGTFVRALRSYVSNSKGRYQYPEDLLPLFDKQVDPHLFLLQRHQARPWMKTQWTTSPSKHST